MQTQWHTYVQPWHQHHHRIKKSIPCKWNICWKLDLMNPLHHLRNRRPEVWLTHLWIIFHVPFGLFKTDHKRGNIGMKHRRCIENTSRTRKSVRIFLRGAVPAVLVINMFLYLNHILRSFPDLEPCAKYDHHFQISATRGMTSDVVHCLKYQQPIVGGECYCTLWFGFWFCHKLQFSFFVLPNYWVILFTKRIIKNDYFIKVP